MSKNSTNFIPAGITEEFQRFKEQLNNQLLINNCTTFSNTSLINSGNKSAKGQQPQITIIGAVHDLLPPPQQDNPEDETTQIYAQDSQIKPSLATTVHGSQQRPSKPPPEQQRSKTQLNKSNIGQQLELARMDPKGYENATQLLQPQPLDSEEQQRSSLFQSEQLQKIEEIKEKEKDLLKVIMHEYQMKKQIKRSVLATQSVNMLTQVSTKSGCATDDTIVMGKQIIAIRYINFEMIQIDKYSVTTNFQLPVEVVSFIKNQKGVSFEFQTNAWILPIDTYKEVLINFQQKIERMGGAMVKIHEISQIAFDIVDHAIPFSSPHIKPIIKFNYNQDLKFKPRLGQLPCELLKKLYNFQKVGIQFGIDHHCRVLLGDEMGVGKTVQAISLSYLYQRDWPVLIITPSSLKYAWRDEIQLWLGADRIKSSHIAVICKENQEFYQPQVQYYIISYSLAWKLSALLQKLNFQFIIVDEAHYLKSREAKRSQHLLPIIMRAKRILLLTGTPLLARPSEIYNLLKILRPDVFRSFKEFGHRYCNPRENIFGVDWTGSSNMRELHLLLEKSLMIRRLKYEVLFELPAKRRQKIVVQIDERHQKKISQHLKKVKKWEQQIEQEFNCLDTLESIHTNTDKYSFFLKAYSLTGIAKVKGVQSFIETLIDNRAKFLLFAHHYDVLDALEDFIVKKQVSYIRIDGRIDNKKRHEAVKKFQSDPNCTVALLSLTASSQGITLTAASIVVFAEMNWTPGIMVQAEDRAHRIGQSQSVLVYYIYGESTLDKLIYPRLQVKSEIISAVVDGKKKNQFQLESQNFSSFDGKIESAATGQVYKRRRGNENVPMNFDSLLGNIQSDDDDSQDEEDQSPKNQINLPSLIKYNQSFSKEDNGKRKNKEKQKMLDMLTCYKSLTELERQQTNIKDFFFNMNRDITPEELEALKQMRLNQSSLIPPDSETQISVNPFISQSLVPLPLIFDNNDEQQCDEILPLPPLFTNFDKQQQLKADQQEDDDPLEDDKWKQFTELRQKKRKLMKESNPLASCTTKIPPPPLPPMRPRMIMNNRRHQKYRKWRRYQGKTMQVNGGNQGLMSCVIGDTQNDAATVNSCSMFGFKPRVYNTQSDDEDNSDYSGEEQSQDAIQLEMNEKFPVRPHKKNGLSQEIEDKFQAIDDSQFDTLLQDIQPPIAAITPELIPPTPLVQEVENIIVETVPKQQQTQPLTQALKNTQKMFQFKSKLITRK